MHKSDPRCPLYSRRRRTKPVDFVPLRRGEAQHVEDPPFTRLSAPSVAVQEALRALQMIRDLLEAGQTIVHGDVASEDQDLEAGVSGKEVVNLEWAGVRGTNEDLREHALSDDEVGGERLMCDVHDRRWTIADSDTAREAAGFLMHPGLGCQRGEKELRWYRERTHRILRARRRWGSRRCEVYRRTPSSTSCRS